MSLIGGDRLRTLDGPTPLQAAYLGSDLAERLLLEAPDDLDAVRIELHPRDFFNFSWELRAPVVQRIAQLGAAVEFCVNTDEPDFESFDPVDSEVELEIRTGQREPGEVSMRLGLAPTELLRCGDPVAVGHSRRMIEGRWALSVMAPGVADLDALVVGLCDRLPEDTAAVAADYRRSCLRMVFRFVYGTGGFCLAPETVARVATLGVPLGCWIWPG